MSTEQQNEKVIAFVLYPELTLLDLIGPLQVLATLGTPYRSVVVGERVEVMDSDTRLRVMAERSFDEVKQPFAVIVPGGLAGTFRAMGNPTILDYLRSTAETAEVVGSVCTGSLVLAAAGLLKGRKATTHWTLSSQLEKMGAQYVKERWVEDGKFITAAGVSAGIDMAIYLAARLTNEATARMIQLAIEYDPQPPFGGIDWSQADVAAFEQLFNLKELLAEIPAST
jgi:transcriptional regulator GlxA family with amidase domain